MNENVSKFMNRKNIEMMAVIGLSLVLALVLKNRFMGHNTVTRSSSPTASSGLLLDSKPHPIEQGNVQPPGRPEKLAADELSSSSHPSPASLRRDLFSPVNAAYDPLNLLKKGGARTLALKAIFLDSQNPLAIINDKVVRMGESIDGAKVLEIRENEVVLSNGKQVSTLKLNKEYIK